MIWVVGAVAVIALVVGVIALALSVTITRRVGARDPLAVPQFWRRALRIRARSAAVDEYVAHRNEKELVAFIGNPTKDGVAEIRERVMRACSIRYMPQPLWFYTTPEDAGTEVAKQAVEAGASVVIAVGGDGTVRAVATALAGTDVAMGILPMGTGNILARNLDLPLSDPTALIRTVLEGEDKRIDVGWMEVRRGARATPDPEEHIFLVMAGAGIDAQMVAGADNKAKSRMGWLAYFVAAVQHMGDKRMTATVAVDDGEAVESQMRSVLMANCGKLPGGFQLIPDASVTDGTLDIATLDARGGIVGWTDLFGTVVAQGAGIKQPEVLKAWRASRIDHTSGRSVVVEMDQPQRVQADGESLGRAVKVKARIEPSSLTVRVPGKNG
jgi:diacylglycerol kinase family enzyme